jgi:hypothetical protein
MTKTLIHEDYETDQFDKAEYPVHESTSYSRVRGGISPFTLPDAVQVEVSDRGECSFVFAYPDSEPPAKQRWEWLADSQLRVTIGAYSRRILELHIGDAVDRIGAGPMRLDPRAAWAWCGNAPPRIRNTATRNAEIVSRIMETLPDGLRAAIVQAILDVKHDGAV